jgi:hypothetical protein
MTAIELATFVIVTVASSSSETRLAVVVGARGGDDVGVRAAGVGRARAPVNEQLAARPGRQRLGTRSHVPLPLEVAVDELGRPRDARRP